MTAAMNQAVVPEDSTPRPERVLASSAAEARVEGGDAAVPGDQRNFLHTRRSGGRRNLTLAEHRTRRGAESLVAREWARIGILLPALTALLGLAAGALPGIAPAILVVLAIGILAATRKIAGWLDDPQLADEWRLARAVVLVCLPMVLFGLGIGIWTRADPALWFYAMSALVPCALLAGAVHGNRIVLRVAAQVALWVGFACAISTIAAIGAAIGGTALVAASYRRQLAADTRAAEEAELGQRIQNRAQEILADYEQTGQGWFFETDRRAALTYVSPTVGQVLGRDAAGLVGALFQDLFFLDDGGQESERTLAFHLSARSAFTDLAVRAAVASEERWWSISGRPLYDGFNNFVGFRGWGSDLTEKRRSQEDASRLAHYDSLTGLSNRFQMSQSLEKVLAAHRIDQRACAVFLLDLDRFKQVNDTLGHPAGDALLTQVAQRLERTVDRQGLVGRLGGDEFQVIIPGQTPRDQLAVLARNVIEQLSHPYSIDGHRVVIGASIGIALAPGDGVTSEALIRNADLALYAAKDRGRGRHHFYAADLHSDAQERRQLEQDLRDALAHGELELHYQPVVHTATEQITGFEALIRWNHPVNGPMSPAKFIPVAEDAGLIAPIGEWALRTACHQLAKWPEHVRIAVNVSALQFANPALPAIVTQALAQAQVHPSRLELEITESVFLNEDEDTEAMFAALKRVGVRLALDDFGTGYSSLGYLKKAPFDKIKIDQSFVSGATQPGSRNGAIISSIVNLAEALGMETTAEGVETFDQLDLVRMLGCSHVQGYIYARAMTPDDASAHLAAGVGAVAMGPRSARAVRQTMLRKVLVEHGGDNYNATIRNISATGALIEGLANVPPGTIFQIIVGDGQIVTGTTRWCHEDRMGVEFAYTIDLDSAGRITPPANAAAAVPRLLKTG